MSLNNNINISSFKQSRIETQRLTPSERVKTAFEVLFKTIFSLGTYLFDSDNRKKWRSVFTGKRVVMVVIRDNSNSEMNKADNIGQNHLQKEKNSEKINVPQAKASKEQVNDSLSFANLADQPPAQKEQDQPSDLEVPQNVIQVEKTVSDEQVIDLVKPLEESAPFPFFDGLPNEVIAMILPHLSDKDLVAMAKTGIRLRDQVYGVLTNRADQYLNTYIKAISSNRVKSNPSESIKLFFRLGANPNKVLADIFKGYLRDTDLVKTTKHFFSENKSLLNVKDKRGKAPIHYAIESANLDNVKFMVELGADINIAEGQEGLSPLAYFCKYPKSPDVEILQYLLRMKADPNARDRYGNTPLHIIVKNAYNHDGDYLTLAKESMKLLVKYGADVDAKNNFKYTIGRIAESDEDRSEIHQLFVDLTTEPSAKRLK